MCFLIEAVYCMTWIWTLYRAHNQWKSPIEEDNVWATLEPTKQTFNTTWPSPTSQAYVTLHVKPCC